MTTQFKPMLAAALTNPAALNFPVVTSPKLDGIRAVVLNGVLVSRTLKPIPNDHTREMFSRPEFEGFDGELIVGAPTAPECFNRTTSAVMSKEGQPDVYFHVFDQVPHAGQGATHYAFRVQNVRFHYEAAPHSAPAATKMALSKIKLVPTVTVWSLAELQETHKDLLAEGYEGTMIRSAEGPYKCGRSTEREGYLLKYKPIEDDEAVILEVVEKMTNNNVAKKNALGHTERSTCKENLTPAGTMGALRVRNSVGQEFSIGTGWTDSKAAEIWESRDRLVGATITYTYQSQGMKDLPRFPSFKGLRLDVTLPAQQA